MKQTSSNTKVIEVANEDGFDGKPGGLKKTNKRPPIHIPRRRPKDKIIVLKEDEEGQYR